ncbi:transposase [Brevibacillus thermoruber]|uniref:Transposase n=1 Tax=Brevibacillus thermoruber TaxID=33942 RepID=A0A9X3TV24_9BACL|nr:transposase [Brevibacillus thermoruber]MDA5111147.1 transposase [Brevibacillus thermoruber]
MGKIRKTYPIEIKRKAVHLYLEGDKSYKTIAKELGISDKNIVMRWVKHFENEGMEGLEEKRGKAVGPRKGRPRKCLFTLEEENLRLRAENEYLKKWLGLERR